MSTNGGETGRTPGIEEARALAASKGGECLSTKVTSIRVPLDWRCSAGHPFSMTLYSALIKGAWCPECAAAGKVSREPHTIEEMRVIAEEKHGHCLSERIGTMREPLLWRCSAGHEFSTTPANVIHKHSWCPTCHKARRGSSKRFTDVQLQAIASEHGGEFVSREPGQQKAKFRCSNGHEWET